jgi:hypothetical protein
VDNDYKCSEEQFKICTKSAFCHLCDGERLFKKPDWMRRRDKELEQRTKKQKEGMGFEKRVQKKYDKSRIENDARNKPDIGARRRPNSGAIWSMPGDIVTPTELMECKERGSKTSKGVLTITISKQQLDKIQEEAILAKKNRWFYVFGFKDSSDIYVVRKYEDELETIQMLNYYKEKYEELLEKEIK